MATKKVDVEKDKTQHNAQSNKEEALKSWHNLYPDLLKAFSTGDKAALDKAYESARTWRENYLDIIKTPDAEENKKMREELDLVFSKARLLGQAFRIIKGPISDVSKNTKEIESAINRLLRTFDSEDKPKIDAAIEKTLPVLEKILKSISVRPLLTDKINLNMKEFSPDDYENTLAGGFRPIDMVRWDTSGVTFWRQDENCYTVTASTPKYSLTWKQINILAAIERTWSVGPFVMRHEDLVKLLKLKDISYTNAKEAKVVEKIMSA